MGIINDMPLYGIKNGYSRIRKISFDYLSSGVMTVDTSIEFYISKEARDSGANPIIEIYISIPMEAFCGSFIDGGKYADPDPRKTVYNLIMDKNRNLFNIEEEFSIDFRNAEAI